MVRRSRLLLCLAIVMSCSCSWYLFVRPAPQANTDWLAARFEELQSILKNSDEALKRLELEIAAFKTQAPRADAEPLQVWKKITEATKQPIVVEQPVPHGLKQSAPSNQEHYSLIAVPSTELVCTLSENPPTKPDVQMLQVLDTLSFADIDGGVWKQGFDIKYDESRWTFDKPLQVFVIPHSHTDPGWVKTFDQYFDSQVSSILNNMVDKLSLHKNMTFVYAEISYFSKWWNGADTVKKDTVKQLIREGRFEVVTGGWVMSDEAAAHYFAMLDQLIEGHAWIRNNLGEDVKPVSGWSIDPFGHSSTMAYLLRASGLENMVISRIHYSIKKHFATERWLEFNWRQSWDNSGSTDILCHVMPFYAYDVPHTCGPDPKVCCQFDFKRLPGGGIKCPWGVDPIPITAANVQERANMLLDQYKKKSSLYKSNVLLIPLGDDFRYFKPEEWDQQYSNYQMLFDYMNTQSNGKVKAKFGTVTEYFNALRKESGSEVLKAHLSGYPVLTGDFYTYADRVDHYWSGYFTSRPFYKHWDRQLETTLRSAEILYTLARAKADSIAELRFPYADLYEKLTISRRSLGLFQHHDAITGTARDFVVVDYGNRILEGWLKATEVIKTSAQMLMSQTFDGSSTMFDIDVIRQHQDDLPSKSLLQLSGGQRKQIVIYNMLPHKRTEMVRVYTSIPAVTVTDSTGQIVICQLSPYFETDTSISPLQFKLNFLASVPALGLVTYVIVASQDASTGCSVSTVSLYNYHGEIGQTGAVFNVDKRSENEISISNTQLEAFISTNSGMISRVMDRESGISTALLMDFIHYNSAAGKDHSGGSYLFQPLESAKEAIREARIIRVIKGSLFHEVQTFHPNIEHYIRLVNTPGPESLAIDVQNLINISPYNNYELGMRIRTDIKDPEQRFFSDLNGFTMHKRHYQPKLPIQGNFYPMTSTAYLEHAGKRLSVLAAQSAGVASVEQGELQIMLDRRLSQDDNLGMGQPVMDNKRTMSHFYLLVEQTRADSKVLPEQPIGYPSMLANILQHHLTSALIVLPVVSGSPSTIYSPVNAPWPCELVLVNLRSQQPREDKSREKSMLILHHQAADCSFPAKGLTCHSADGTLDVRNVLKDFSLDVFEKSLLTDLHQSEVADTPIQLKPMTIATFDIILSPSSLE